MEKLKELIKKELQMVEEKGLTAANLDSTSKLIDMYKDLEEAGGMEGMYGYRDTYYRANRGDNYGAYEPYGRDNYERGYGRQYMDGSNYNRSNYGGYDSRMRNHIDRISEGAEMYEYGRDRYQHGGSESGMVEGLEKLMYALCTFVETTMDFAQSPQEKEIIRKHINKIRNF